jgi:hypothetical protein
MNNENITLPGSIPGLLRRGSPALVSLHLKARAVTIHGIRDGLAWFASDGCDTVVVASISVLALDLTDATGRAHAAWWLDEYGGRWTVLQAGRRGAELLRLLECAEASRFHTREEAEQRGKVRMALAGLSPSDSRLLPDGSRWVDAEALRRVVLHVAEAAP